jgi:WhiB family redox-sensing transcriptional regulator
VIRKPAHAHQQGHQEDIVRLTTLLDTVNQGGSGPWPPSPVITTDENNQQFDQMVAGLIPCRSNDPELWFAEQTAQVELAKALCRECPLVEGCLAGAVERAEPWGVWGGEVFVGGVVVATKRGRGRPRKSAAPAA